jgi:hypothetical protein
MSTVWCKKWLTVLGHLVSGARFDCFDPVNTVNKKKDYSISGVGTLWV